MRMILIDYFDVWGNEEDGFEVNNLARYDERPVGINDPEDEVDILISLVSYGYLKPEAVKLLEVDFSMNDFCLEINIRETGEPVCRLEYTED